MSHVTQNAALRLVDDLVADGKTHFTFGEAQQRFGQSPSATGNLLHRMLTAGLIDRVRRGHYAIRQLGVLGTPSVAEEVALAVGAAFAGTPHRMAYRTALDEHDLIVHPARSIYVATSRRTRTKTLSGRPLHVVPEPKTSISVGAIACGSSWVSGIERALLGDTVVRIVSSPNEQTLNMIKSLQIAGHIEIHRQDDDSMCFDLLPPQCQDSDVWAERVAVFMSKVGFNAFKASRGQYE